MTYLGLLGLVGFLGAVRVGFRFLGFPGITWDSVDGGLQIPDRFPGILVSWGRRHRVPQTGGLKTTEISSLAVLEARSLKARCQRGRTPSLRRLEESVCSVSVS